MYRSIARFLVLFLVVSSLSWAMDTDEFSGHGDSAWQQLSVDDAHHASLHDGDLETLKDVPCNHCCHGTAHYLGMPYDACMFSAGFVSDGAVRPLNALRSRAKEPPQHPPKIQIC